MSMWALPPDMGCHSLFSGRLCLAGVQGSPAAADATAQRPDWGGAYSADGTPHREHDLWLAAMGILGSMLRALPSSSPVADAALQLVIAAQQRLVTALQPPAGSSAQPITLAGLQVHPLAPAEQELKLALALILLPLLS